MANTTTAILEALATKLGTLVLSPSLPVAWPGIHKKPPSTGMWLETRFFPNESVDLVWDNNSQLSTTGFFQVSIYWRPGEGSLIAASGVADSVINLFSKGTAVGPVRVKKTPWQSPSVDVEGKSFIPVTIPYRGILYIPGYSGAPVVGSGTITAIVNDLLTRLDSSMVGSWTADTNHFTVDDGTSHTADGSHPLLQSLLVAWPGVHMKPPSTGIWLETRFLPKESEDLVWGNNTQKNTTGSLLVNVFYRPGTNTGQSSQVAASKIADSIITLFPKGLGVGAVRISKPPWQGPSVDLEGKSYIPVMVPYRGVIAVAAA